MHNEIINHCMTKFLLAYDSNIEWQEKLNDIILYIDGKKDLESYDLEYKEFTFTCELLNFLEKEYYPDNINLNVLRNKLSCKKGDITLADRVGQEHLNNIHRSDYTQSFVKIGKFEGNFAQDILNAEKHFCEDIKKIRYKDANLDHPEGLPPSTESTFKLKRQDYPTFNSIVEHIGFEEHENFGIRLKLFKQSAGCMVPYHMDNYSTSTVNDIRQVDQHLAGKAVRVAIALTEWQPGQIWSFGKENWTEWSIGECIYWSSDVPHGTANFGHATRYNLQITGIPSQKTYDLINSQEPAIFTL